MLKTNLTKKPIIPILFGLLIIALVVTALSIFAAVQNQKKAIKPKSLPVTSLPATVPQVQLTYSYQGELPPQPESIPVYNVEKEKVLDEAEAESIAKSFGFSTIPETLPHVTGTMYLATQGDTSLAMYTNPPKLNYGNYQQPTADSLGENQLIEKAQEFLTKYIELDSQLSLGKAYFQPLTTDNEGGMYPIASLSEASLVKISFDITLNNIPILNKENQVMPIYLVMNLDGTVRKATINLFPGNFSSLGKATFTSPQEALLAINNGIGTVAKLDNPNQRYGEINTALISQATLHSLEVVYIYDQDTATLQPYYRFSGNAKTKDQQAITIEVLITALPQEVFQQ